MRLYVRMGCGGAVRAVVSGRGCDAMLAGGGFDEMVGGWRDRWMDVLRWSAMCKLRYDEKG
jgi:hypothetical protein